jgi:penicillin G amidase
LVLLGYHARSLLTRRFFVNTLLRWLRRCVVLIIVFILAAVIGIYALIRGSLPQLSGDFATAALHGQVTIQRDALGVVSIKGSSRPDVSYALGFVHAQERFFAMDLMRRAAAGELSELVGAVAVPIDKQHRAFRMRARAKQVLSTLAPEQRADIAAYSAGANAGLAALRSRPWEYWLLGSLPRAWSEDDSILVLDTMAFDLNDTTNSHELAYAKMQAALPASVYRLLRSAGGPLDAPLLGPPMPPPAMPPADDIDLSKLDPKLLKVADTTIELPEIIGSNSFAVGGTLTASHAAMVANDMHLGLRVPNIWFRARLQYPSTRRPGETIDLIGVTLPGLPTLVAGSNLHVAWAFTNSYGDWLDWVRVNLDPADKNQYRVAEGMLPLQQSTEIIKVHNAADEKLEVHETRWGPILADDVDGTPLALAWTVQQLGGVNLDLLHLDVAESVDEAIDTANHAGMPVQNFVVGDAAGNIGWTLAGRIPRRIGGYDPSLPADWSQPGMGWSGWLEPKEYPRLPNPASARLWTANARLLDFESADYAHVGDGGYDLGARAAQIRDDLRAKTSFVPADFLAIQLDDRAVLLNHWHDLLRDTLTHTNGVKLDEMKRLTADWKGHADIASVGYRLTRAFRLEVLDTVLDGFAAAVRQKFPDFKMPFLSENENIVDAILVQRPAHLLPPGYKDWNDLLSQCALRVANKLGAMPGGLAARNWGEANTTHIRHPLSSAIPGMGWLLDMPSEPLPGDSNMPRVQGPAFGASERFGVEPGHEENGYLHMPGGQSGNPLSPFYGAGHADWAQGKATPFMPGETKYTLTLSIH